ncbi:MAG: hypothetical protein HON94_02390 [Methylococcales bacterium]|jgi:hypothetical protein|nr:hypothetical protein [Methylococcales bacterium]MBT7408700.1 hypothetical protein [Methylococcales bacterium]
MTAHDTQSFFTPDEFFCKKTQVLSQTYNLAHILLNRSQSKHIFVPIRSMQYLAIVEKNTFWFVDSLAYAVRKNEGGRLIRISWHPLLKVNQREGLTQNMECRVVFYGEDMEHIQNRLNSEFYQSMLQIDQRHRSSINTNSKISILPLGLG